jgi:hypothetical protein
MVTTTSIEMAPLQSRPEPSSLRTLSRDKNSEEVRHD